MLIVFELFQKKHNKIVLKNLSFTNFIYIFVSMQEKQLFGKIPSFVR